MPGWVATIARGLLTLLLVIGIGIAVYLTWHHDNQLYGDASARLSNCPHTETVNCDLVNTSPWSEFLGIPIAAFAIPTYLFVILLLWLGRTKPRLISYAFCIGLATASLSAILFYVSKTQIGFLCLWCLRLYGVNLAIPILAALCARQSPGGWRSPTEHLSQTARDLRSWPKELRFASVGFVLLLAGALATEYGYRSQLERRSTRDLERIMEDGGPTVPAVPADVDGDGSHDSGGSDSSAPPDPSSANTDGRSDLGVRLLGGSVAFAAETPAPGSQPPPRGPYKLAGPLRRLSGSRAGLRSEPFDLQSRLGKGRPVALLFWHPGFDRSETSLTSWSQFLRKETPGIEVYAVSGRREDEHDEEIWERFSMLDLPADLPLLVDDTFKVSQALEVQDVPNVTLFDPKGVLVVAKLKSPGQDLVVPSGRASGAEVVRRLAAGTEVPTIQRMFPYFPGSDLFGSCARPFTLNKFNTQESFTFTGRSSSRRPTILVFWSSTCKHCQVEIPQLVAWVRAHAGAADVVSVTQIRKDRPETQSHRKVTEAYIRTQKIQWPVLEDPDGAVNDLYGVVSTPTTFFIAPDGTILDAWYFAHPTGFEEAMTKELAKAPAGACRAVPRPPAARLDFTAMAQDGRRVPLASLLDKPALVHFWATWCAPCIKELPGLMRFRDALEKSGEGRVVLVSVEDAAAGARIEKFQKERSLDLRSLRAPAGGLADKVDLAYQVPRTFLVAPDGTVIGARRGEQDWSDASITDSVRSRLRNSGAPPAPAKTAARH